MDALSVSTENGMDGSSRYITHTYGGPHAISVLEGLKTRPTTSKLSTASSRLAESNLGASSAGCLDMGSPGLHRRFLLTF
jgi:hypothetical protein